MFCEHLPGGEAHDAAPHRGKHPHLEAGEGDHGGTETRGHEQRAGDGNLEETWCEASHQLRPRLNNFKSQKSLS